MVIFEIVICTKFHFSIIFINFGDLEVSSHSICGIYCMLIFCCVDVSRTSWGHQTMTSLTDISMTPKLNIYRIKQLVSQYVTTTPEIDIRK